jgi:hypothetical protein
VFQLSKALLDKLTVSELVSKLHVCYGTWWLVIITVFSRGSWMQPSHSVSLRSILLLSSISLLNDHFIQNLRLKSCMHDHLHIFTMRATCPVVPTLLNLPPHIIMIIDQITNGFEQYTKCLAISIYEFTHAQIRMKCAEYCSRERRIFSLKWRNVI